MLRKILQGERRSLLFLLLTTFSKGMILHYLYILKSGIFENVGFNFGGAHRFKYDLAAQDISVSETPFYTPNFFKTTGYLEHDAIVQNVTAIIGENGVGKTSLLDFIKQNFLSGINGISTPVIVALTDDNGTLKIYHDQAIPIRDAPKGVPIIITPLKSTNSNYKLPSNVVVQVSAKPEIPEFSETTFISLSNVFDNVTEYEFDGLINLSTNYLIRNSLRKTMDDFGLDRGADLRRTEFEEFRTQEVRLQLNYVDHLNRSKRTVPFPLPTRLAVSAERDFIGMSISSLPFQAKDMLTAYSYENFIAEFSRYSKMKFESAQEAPEKAIVFFAGNMIINFFIEISRYTRFYRIASIEDFEINDNEMFQIVFERLIDILKDDASRFRKVSAKSTRPYREYEKDLDQLKAFSEFYEFLKINLSINNTELTGKSFLWGDISGENKIADFLRLYNRTYNFQSFLRFDWPDLSSGQKAFLNIYARLFSVSDQSFTKLNLDLLPKRNIILLIDEGEAYMHPNWQKAFIRNLLDFLPANFGNSTFTRSVQCLLTSNSPFLASDLPSSNVVFLKRSDSGQVIIQDSLDEKKQTFAANTHMLYSDAFFMQNGTIGEFAKLQINRVIDLLQDKQKVIEDNRTFVENVINLIGEPIIKSKLTQMLADRLNVNAINLVERVKNLEREVRELKSGNL